MCSVSAVGGDTAVGIEVGACCDAVVCSVCVVASGLFEAFPDAVGAGAVAGGALAAARACAAAMKSCELGGAAPHQVAVVEAGGGAVAGAPCVAPVGGRAPAWVSADVIEVGDMVVVSCVAVARGVGGPVCGATTVGVAAIGVALVPRGVLW